MCKFPRKRRRRRKEIIIIIISFFLFFFFFFKKSLEINMFNFLWVEYIGMMSPLDGNYFLSSSLFFVIID
jgi:hypothetical protein